MELRFLVMEMKRCDNTFLIVLTENVWLHKGIAMLMPEILSSRISFGADRVPVNVSHYSNVIIAVDCRIFIRGQWEALYKLLTKRPDAIVIWMTRPETGMMFPRERRGDRLVNQLLDTRLMRKVLLDVLKRRRINEHEVVTPQTLSTTEKKLLPYFLAGINLDELSVVTGSAKKTLHCQRQRIMVKAGFRTWSYFQYVHQQSSCMRDIAPVVSIVTQA